MPSFLLYSTNTHTFFFLFLFFFFNDTATTEIYTLSLHDALPIRLRQGGRGRVGPPGHRLCPRPDRRWVRSRPGHDLMMWSLATYQLNGAVGVAALREDGTLVAPPDRKRWTTTLDVLEDWAHAEPVLRAIDVEDAPVIDYDRLLAPLRWPRKVICAGVNYRRHVREMGGEIPPDGWKPFFFLKPPTTTVIGPADAITVRAPGTARYDWEAELAAVIGIGGREIPSEDALGHLAGYCVANDVTARGHHKRDNVPAD